MSAYVVISQLMKSYPKPGGGQAVIVKDFNLKIARGEFVTVIGHSGCGKSTQLMMLAGLSEITAGGIVIAEKEITGPGPDRGIVFQSPSQLPWMTARKRDARSGAGFFHRDERGARTNRGILSQRRRPRGCNG